MDDCRFIIQMNIGIHKFVLHFYSLHYVALHSYESIYLIKIYKYRQNTTNLL